MHRLLQCAHCLHYCWNTYWSQQSSECHGMSPCLAGCPPNCSPASFQMEDARSSRSMYIAMLNSTGQVPLVMYYWIKIKKSSNWFGSKLRPAQLLILFRCLVAWQLPRCQASETSDRFSRRPRDPVRSGPRLPEDAQAELSHNGDVYLPSNVKLSVSDGLGQTVCTDMYSIYSPL